MSSYRTVTRTFDAAGQLTAEVGVGADASSASRAQSYDAAGRLASVDTPAGAQTFEYDDRGLLTRSAGPLGLTTNGYDLAGRVIRRDDGAGAHVFTWTPRGELDTAADPVSGATHDFGYDPAGRLNSVAYGSAGLSRSLSRDEAGRLLVDRLTGSGGAQLARTAYGYDADGNVTSKTETVGADPAAASHAYAYDRASRLTGWTKPDGTATAYAWDAADNRLSAGADLFSYDERNRLATGPAGRYSWTPRGTLLSVQPESGAPTGYTFDGLGRQVAAGGVTFGYDGLDRLTSRAGVQYTYSGRDSDALHDGAATYGRGPGGELLGVEQGGVRRVAGLNAHGDVALSIDPAAGLVTGATTYQPFGAADTVTGQTPGQAGFQGDLTDQASGLVWMGARWYEPAAGVFTSRDSMARRVGSAT